MERWTALVAMMAGLAGAATPLEAHGRLSVKGNLVVGEDGSAANLRGMSLYWSQWAPQYWNRGVVNWLVSDWKSSLVRAAMAVDEGGYLANPAVQMKRVDSVVQAAIDNDIYVIIDWHDHDANKHVDQAKTFFETMAKRWGDKPNVIWEIWNEPNDKNGSGANGYDTWSDIKWYANQVIPVIRAHSQNVIVVGTSSWSQGVDEAAADPIQGANIAYTLHFYATEHRQWLRDRAAGAMNSGVALFATEWGTCEADGNGDISWDESSKWLSFLDEKGISWANWSIVDKDETCAALAGGAASNGGWGSSELTASGRWVRDEIRKRSNYDPVVRDTFAVPGTVDASKPTGRSGTKAEADEGGTGSHLAYIDSGTYAEYTIRAANPVRVATKVSAAGANAGGSIVWSLDGETVATTAVEGTGGWQAWKDAAGPQLLVPAGTHALRLSFVGSGTGLFNLRSIDLADAGRDTTAIPGIVDATRPSAFSGPQIEYDAAGSHLAYVDAGASVQYVVRAAKSGAYAMTLSVASPATGASIGWSLDGRSAGTTFVPASGGWTTWTDVEGPSLPLAEGVHVLKLDVKGVGAGLFNLDGIAMEWSRPLVVARMTESVDGVAVLRDRVSVAGGSWTRVDLLDASGRVLESREIGGSGAELSLASLKGRGFLRLAGPSARIVPVVSIR